jgi:anti-anti-sigma regulatory factor
VASIRENGGSLKVAGATGPARKVFQLTGLDKIIPLYDDVESAAG